MLLSASGVPCLKGVYHRSAAQRLGVELGQARAAGEGAERRAADAEAAAARAEEELAAVRASLERARSDAASNRCLLTLLSLYKLQQAVA